MEQIVNIPIQMISVCSTAGDLTPMRFRFETPEHQLETVHVESVHAHKLTTYNGIREIQYVCSAYVDNLLKLFVLKYNIDSHKWIMFKFLS